MSMPAPFLASDVTAENPALLANELAARVGQLLSEAISTRGVATLVVSGGSTPQPFLQALARLPVEWSSVVVTLADERWVDNEHADSNHAFLCKHLFQGAARAARFVSLKTDHPTPDDGWAECERNLAAMPRPFDVVVLGMGSDAHTASLFPGAGGLQQAIDLKTKRLCWPMHPAAVAQPRMTLTLAALLASRHLFLHITGEEKRLVLERALVSGDPLQYPVASLVAFGRERLRIYWAD